MAERQYFEFLTYHLINQKQAGGLEEYLQQAAIPAYESMGIGPVGVFSSVYGPHMASRFVLLPHPNLESVAGCRARLLADSNFVNAAAGFLKAPMTAPSYVRMESSLMADFEGIPQIELPANNSERKSRIFALRRYESHNLTAAKKKIEMFNQGGELALFRRIGLQPVFFGETLIGPRMPNLTYMLTFDSMRHREDTWNTFLHDPEWAALRDDPQYADIVSDITESILKPAECSQI